MNTNEKGISTLQIAKLNEVANVETIESKLPAYSIADNSLPVTVSFHQEFITKEKTTVYFEKEIVETDETGEVIYEEVERQVKGKMITVFQPKLSGKTERKKTRVETGQTLNDKRNYKCRFVCANEDEFRYEFGSALNEFFTALESGDCNLKKSEKVNMTFKFNDKVLSTKYLSYGGIKLSKCFKKGKLEKSSYSDNFCKPLFRQIQAVANGEANKPLEIDTAILEIIGLNKK